MADVTKDQVIELYKKRLEAARSSGKKRPASQPAVLPEELQPEQTPADLAEEPTPEE